MQPHQPHSPATSSLLPGFVSSADQVIFIQPGPDMFLRGELEIIKLQLDPLTGNQLIRFYLRQTPFQFRVEIFNNRLTLRPLVDILHQSALDAN